MVVSELKGKFSAPSYSREIHSWGGGSKQTDVLFLELCVIVVWLLCNVIVIGRAERLERSLWGEKQEFP